MLVNAPDYLFSYPSLLLISFVVVVMSLSIGRRSVGGVNFGIQTMVGGLTVIIVGCQIWVLALFSFIAANPINKPDSALIGAVRDYFQLGHGASIGILAAAVGVLYLGIVFGRWLLAGKAVLPSATATLFASTVVVLVCRLCSARSS